MSSSIDGQVSAPSARTHESRAPEALSSASARFVNSRAARARLARVLDAMDADKRALLVMFEIEELPCDEIAAIVGAPVGTVWSRLHAARRQFEARLARLHARESRGAR